ncbi:MAG: hypothetical protein H6860_01915 [Rhodospirillales bacterium]|nr:hypothetical protein [Alphaproteobacteria bacterium]MCB9981137.1 hypothetical protein [Rhodospirillales bacterium]
MKAALKTCILGLAVLGLSACETGMGFYDDAPPYEIERTATHMQSAPAPTPVAESPATPEPCSKPCMECDYSEWEARALQAEHDLRMCQEATDRVRDAYREELKK